MTVGELYSQVSQLGFEDALEHDDRFYYAANRALLQVNTLRPATKSLLINHNPIKNMLKSSSFKPISRVKDITFEAVGAKAYSFEADGNGVLYVERYENGKGWLILNMKNLNSKGFTTYKDFIKDADKFTTDRVRLRFGGEFFYSIRNIALYEHLYSNKIEDIPSYEAFSRYDMTKYTDDFIGFAESPIFADGENLHLNQDYNIESASVLLLPYDKEGAYKVIYKRRPKEIKNMGANPDSDTTVIDLDEELCYALPNLVAAYIWAEDEPDLAEYYLTLYRERAAELVASTKNTAPAVYKSCNGW